MRDQKQTWQTEQQRVDTVLQEISKRQEKLSEKAGNLKEGIVTLRRNFWDDVTVNMDEPDDIIETQASLKQQAELLSERERSHGHLSDQLKTLKRLQDSPYFGRIDFLEDGDKETEPIYIGIASLMDEKEEDFLIYDWRAPISSMYYDYPPGPAEFETIEGPVKGEIELKRQYIIRNGEIKGLFDTGVTIGDRLLQEMLGNHGGTKMKSIVATIQREQNKIIRNERSKFLVVQGVAGSGKTSAALQRVAYLLYAHRETLNADNIILFSPNPLFNSYVATVLPELGEENMLQTTYADYVEDRVGQVLNLEGPFEQMERLLTEISDDSAKMVSIQYKASLEFKTLLDQYVECLAEKDLIFHDILFQDRVLFSSAKIEAYFYGLDHTNSIPNRLELVSERLLEELAEMKQLEQRRDWVTEEMEMLDKEDYLDAFKKMQQRQESDEDTFDDYEQEWDILSSEIVDKHFQPIQSQLEQLEIVDVKGNYRQLFEGWDGLKDLPDQWDLICKETLAIFDQNELAWEDVTPYLYLQDRLQGRKAYRGIRHLFIDEAQDYSPFQMAYLQMLFPYCKMTLLGDSNQAIYAHARISSSVLSAEMVESESKETITLMRSYRSTRPIAEFTKHLIEEGKSIEPFQREGEKPILAEVGDRAELQGKIIDFLNRCQSDGHQTIAVICKTMSESRKVYEQLKLKMTVQLLNQETYTFKKGLVVIPSYLAKGIEFDAVVIYDATQYSRESERKLFYTACTRAMHTLHLFSLGGNHPLLDVVPSHLYCLE